MNVGLWPTLAGRLTVSMQAIQMLASAVIRKTGWIASLDNSASESDVPIRVPLFVSVYVETVLHGGHVERQQVVSGLRKKFNLIARLKDYLFRDHLKIQRHSDSGFVLESANHWVIFWRHGEGLVLAA